MATPPARTELVDTYPDPNTGTFRTGIGKLYDYVLALLGGDGSSLAARTALGIDYAKANMFINGNWQIDQFNEGALYTVTGGAADVLTVDGWSGSAVAAPGVFKVRRTVDPDNAAQKCLEITCTTIDAAIAATDAYYIHTAIEGVDAAGLKLGTAAALPFTISFPFKSNVTGVYGVSVANGALSRSYVGIITVPNTAENTYTITIPGDVTGTWLYDFGAGLRVRLCLAAGSNFQAAAGAWGATNMLTTSSQVNFMSNVANIAQLKPAQCVPGSFAMPIGMPNYVDDLEKCQRHAFKTFPQGTAVTTNAGLNTGEMTWYNSSAGAVAQTARQRLDWPVIMRGTPTVLLYNPAVANNQIRDVSAAGDCTASAAAVPTDRGTKFSYTGNAGGTVAGIISVHVYAQVRLT